MGFWFTLLLYVGTTILTELLRPKPNIEGAKPASLGDFNFPTATEDRAVPLIWGTVRLKGPNIIWYGDLLSVPIKKKVKTGLFSSQKVTTGYKYYLGIDMVLCLGELTTAPVDQGIRRIWIDDEVLRPDTAAWIRDGTISINNPEFFGEDSGGVVGDITVYPGSISQGQDAYMAALSEVDSTILPNYRGSCHVVLNQVYIGKQPSLRPWAFEVRRIPNGLNLSAANAVIGDGQANPVNVIYEIMTNPSWGLGITNIDISQFSSAGATLKAEGNGYSRVITSSIAAADLLAEVEQQIDAILVQDVVTKNWQIRLIRETDFPSPLTVLPSFDESNIQSLEYSRGSWSDTTNQVKIQYTDPVKNFQSSFAVAQDMANKIIQDDENIIATSNYPGVMDPTLANTIAWRDLRTLSYPLAKGKMVTDRSNYAVRPGDLVRITWPPYGVEDFYARINRVQLGTAEANELIFDWTEDVFRTETPSFSDPIVSQWTQPSADPVDPVVRIFTLPLGYQSQGSEQEYGVLVERGNGSQLRYDVFIYEDPSLPISVLPDFAVYDQEFVTPASNTDVEPFTPTGLLLNALTLSLGTTVDIYGTQDITTVDESSTTGDLNDPYPDNLVLVDDEIIFFTSLTSLGAGQYRLNGVERGMLDTAVAEHASDAKVWFFTYGMAKVLTDLDPSTLGIAIWASSTSGGGSQGEPISASPELTGFDTVELNDRFFAPSAPINVKIDLDPIADANILGDSFRIDWRNRANSLTVRDSLQNSGTAVGTGNTYTVRVYHTGQSPEVMVYEATGISDVGAASPALAAEHTVSGYAVEFSPETSPWPSPEPFPQTYRVELFAVNGSPEFTSQSWVKDFTRG